MNSAQRTCEVARVILERAAKTPGVTLAQVCFAVGEAIGVLRVESVGGTPQGTPERTPLPEPTYDASSEDYSRGFNECRELDREAVRLMLGRILKPASTEAIEALVNEYLPAEEPDEGDDCPEMEDDPACRVYRT